MGCFANYAFTNKDLVPGIVPQEIFNMGFGVWVSLLLELDHKRAFFPNGKCNVITYGLQMHRDYLYYPILLLLVI